MKTLIVPIIQRALVGCESLSPTDRADLYEGIQILLAPHLPAEARAAGDTATLLREAEQHQLSFAHLLQSSQA